MCKEHNWEIANNNGGHKLAANILLRSLHFTSGGSFYAAVYKFSKTRTSVANYSSREETKFYTKDLTAK